MLWPDHIVLIDHGREIAAGTSADLKSKVGNQRVDVTTADSAAFEQLADHLRQQGFELTRVPSCDASRSPRRMRSRT